MKRSGFKRKATVPMKRTRLHVKGHSTTTQQRDEVQALLRQIVIARDGGCFLRNYKDRITNQYRECGSRATKDGHLILQAEHLHSRTNASSFSDTRLVVCVCERHHLYYKPQHSAEYNELAREFIGEKNAELWDRVKNDRLAHKVDLKLAIVGLKQELKQYKVL